MLLLGYYAGDSRALCARHHPSLTLACTPAFFVLGASLVGALLYVPFGWRDLWQRIQKWDPDALRALTTRQAPRRLRKRDFSTFRSYASEAGGPLGLRDCTMHEAGASPSGWPPTVAVQMPAFFSEN